MDAVAALRHVPEAVAGLSIETAGLAVAGDSAGATLALVAALALRDEATPSALALFYPAGDMGHRTASMDEFSSGYPLTSSTLRRSEEHTSELQSLMRISYAVFCLKKKNKQSK